jgi:hypothetical protein
MRDRNEDPEPHVHPGLVPEVEETLVVSAIVSTFSCASRGRFGRGYNLLVSGLRYAEQSAKEGQPWGLELACRYRRARDNYRQRFLPPCE